MKAEHIRNMFWVCQYSTAFCKTPKYNKMVSEMKYFFGDVTRIWINWETWRHNRICNCSSSRWGPDRPKFKNGFQLLFESIFKSRNTHDVIFTVISSMLKVFQLGLGCLSRNLRAVTLQRGTKLSDAVIIIMSWAMKKKTSLSNSL